MTRRDWFRITAATGLSTAAFGADDIPAHPRELKFGAIEFEPPNAEEHRHELPHGAVAYLVEDHQFPLVDLSATIRVPSWLVPEENWGLAGMVGSQMRSGGTKTLSARDFDEEAAFLATQIGSNIGQTSGSASVGCLKANLDRSLEMFFDMLKNPGFDPERFDLAKAQQLQGMERRNDQTRAIAGREFSRLMRKGHFTSRQITKASLESVTVDSMRELHARYYHPSSFIFAAAGDFDTKEVVDRLSEALNSGWPAMSKPDVPAIPAPTHVPDPGVYLVNKEDVNQSNIRLFHRGIARSNPDHIAVAVMNDILGGGGFVSRITSRVRSDEGLAYSAGSSFRAGTYYPGSFSVGFQSVNAKCAEAAAISIEEIARMRESKATAEELATSINYSVEIFPRFFATAGQIAGTFASDEHTNREKDYWQKYRDRVSSVTADEVLRVAQKYLQPENLTVLGVGHAGQMLAGNPDKPQYSFKNFDKDGEIEMIPLPDPLTMEYPGA